MTAPRRPVAVLGRDDPSGPLLRCGAHHEGPGALDESPRRLSHGELAVARRLVEEGHAVRSVREGRTGPVADLEACGTAVEVKTLEPVRERPGERPATWRTVHNRLASAVRQAAVVVVDGGGSGLSSAEAAAGVRSFAATGRIGRVRDVRVLGDGFAHSWRLVPLREIGSRDPAGRRMRAGERATEPPAIGA